MAAAFQNVLDPEYTRYIDVGDDLWAYLDEKYRSLVGPDYDYRVTYKHDRWSFQAPEELSEKQLRKITNEIVDRADRRREVQTASLAQGTE